VFSCVLTTNIIKRWWWHIGALQSAVLACEVIIIDSVGPSVRLSVWHSPSSCQNDSNYDHAVLEDNLVTLVCSRLTSSRNSKGSISREGAEWDRGRKICKFQPISRRISETVQWRTNRKSHKLCAFDSYQNHRPWMTLNGRYALYCSKGASFRAHCTNLNEDRPNFHLRKCRTVI